MKFVSRSSNYMLVLKPGVPGNQITGTPPVPGVYVRFRDGIVEVKEEELIHLMKASQGFKNGDFIAVDEHGEDPFKDERTGLEPEHIITELKYGTPEGRKVGETKGKLPPAVKKMIQAEAVKIAKEMLPGMVEEVLMAAKASKEADEGAKSQKEAAKLLTKTTHLNVSDSSKE